MSRFFKTMALFAVLLLFGGFVYLLIFNFNKGHLRKRGLRSEIRQSYVLRQEKARCKQIAVYDLKNYITPSLKTQKMCAGVDK